MCINVCHTIVLLYNSPRVYWREAITEEEIKVEKHEFYVRLTHMIFEDILPKYGYVIRQGQVELAKEMVTSLINCNISICEAELGIGKTHAYIVAAILNSLEDRYFNRIRTSYPLTRDYYKTTKMPTVITTSSIALQKAIALDYIPEISRILIRHKLINRPLTSVIRKGKEHYVCDRRIKDYLNVLTQKGTDEKINIKEQQQLYMLKNSSFYDIDLDMYDNISNYIKSRICVSQKCNPSCDMHAACRYNKLIRRARSYSHDFQICNHNYFLADTRHRNKGLSALIPNYRAVIIDEAHKFVSAARQMYGNSISIDELSKLIFYIRKMKFIKEPIRITVERYCNRLQDLEKYLFEELLKPVLNCEVEDDTERYKTQITDTAGRTLKNIVYTIVPSFANPNKKSHNILT
jgi:ATP-dependent DNA helicase DinG